MFGEGLLGRKDATVWQAAQSDDRFLVAQDLHFSDARIYRPGTHAGILVVRLRNPKREALVDRVRVVFEKEDVAGWTGCIVVATDRKVRVRRAAL